MRRTVMVSEGARVTIETGDAGTEVLDEAGMVIAQHGTDQHDVTIAERKAAGWRTTESGDVRPPEAEGAPMPDDGPAGPAGEVDAGPSS
jgi:hypothetical protein